MLFQVTTDKDVQTVKNEIENKAKEYSFSVLKDYVFREILESKGHPIDKDIVVFEICNPVAAQGALSVYPEVSVYLPCRVSVYEKNGKTVISTIHIEDILKNFEIEEEFKTHMYEIFEALKSMMNELAK